MSNKISPNTNIPQEKENHKKEGTWPASSIILCHLFILIIMSVHIHPTAINTATFSLLSITLPLRYQLQKFYVLIIRQCRVIFLSSQAYSLQHKLEDIKAFFSPQLLSAISSDGQIEVYFSIQPKLISVLGLVTDLNLVSVLGPTGISWK